MARKRWVFISDTHGEDVLESAIALICQFNKDYKPDIFVLGGDIVDFRQASKFVEADPDVKRTSIKAESNFVVENILEPIKKSLGPKVKILFPWGNHEVRVYKYIAAFAPGLLGAVSLSDLLEFDRLGIKEFPSFGGNGIAVVGPCHFMHGQRYGVNPAKLTLEEYGAPCVVFGHNHRESTFRKRAGSGLYDHICLGAGCLSKPSSWKGYDNYTRGFVYGWLDEETGEYHAEHARISGTEWNHLYTSQGEWTAFKTKAGWKAKKVI